MPSPAAIASVAAPLAGAVVDAFTSARSAAKNRKFQERMRNTQWQAAVKDMTAAGLNPMLAYGQGPAASPSGSMQAPTDFKGAANSAAMMKAQLEQIRASTNLTQKQAEGQNIANALADSRNIMGDKGEPSVNQEILMGERAQARIRQIEETILRESSSATISSAKSAAAIAEKEVTLAELKNILLRLDIPEKEAFAKWFDTVGAGAPAAMTIGQWLKLIFTSILRR